MRWTERRIDGGPGGGVVLEQWAAQPDLGPLSGTYRILAAVTDLAGPLGALVAGGLAMAGGVMLIRSSGALTGVGRRLAAARTVPLAELIAQAASDELPAEPIRVEGRVRCANPIETPDGDRLAALHRDVEVALPDGRWRTIERLRDTRTVDLWERANSVRIDLGAAAEPLITIPQVWEGSPDELPASYRPAIERLTAEAGPPTAARSTTRQITLVDQLTVLAVGRRDPAGQLQLAPPTGGFVVSAVDLDVAMRLLAGPRRSRMLTGYAVAAVGGAAVLIGLIGLVLAVLA